MTEERQEYEKLDRKIVNHSKKLIKEYIDVSIKDAIRLGLKDQDRRDFVLGRIASLTSSIQLEAIFNSAIDDRWDDEVAKI